MTDVESARMKSPSFTPKHGRSLQPFSFFVLSSLSSIADSSRSSVAAAAARYSFFAAIVFNIDRCLFSCDIVHTIKIDEETSSVKTKKEFTAYSVRVLVAYVFVICCVAGFADYNEEGVGEETLLELELVDLKTRHLPQLQEVSTFGIRFPALRPPLCTNPFICNRVNYTNGPYCVG
ncbi:unnamed protein product [Lactuca saligna]|uniref:Uncharacterized protein n=1 Tax=Lactuca saligna TaxID=75948 RepID=A0AA35YZE1_LACSI|nr:unnamed protein product [Lactuca saligna]